MDPLEQELKRALRREQPSADFAARVLARAEQEKQRRPWWKSWLAVPRVRWAVAVLLIALVLGGVHYQRVQERRRAEGEAARQQVILALQIAGAKVKRAQVMVQELNNERSSRRN
ncbi:MAG TPA: hypothetical protein VF135_05355 [Terriglobales bacterium]